MPTYSKSFGWNDLLNTPGSILTVKKISATFPRISSTLPILRLFCRYTPALKYGTFSSIVHRQTSSDSQSCMTWPASFRVREQERAGATKGRRQSLCARQKKPFGNKDISRQNNNNNNSSNLKIPHTQDYSPTISAGGPSSRWNLPPPPPPRLKPPRPPPPRLKPPRPLASPPRPLASPPPRPRPLPPDIIVYYYERSAARGGVGFFDGCAAVAATLESLSGGGGGFACDPTFSC